MSGPVVVVSGATPESPPPGIESAAALADVRFAPDAATLATTIADAEALFFWQSQRAWIEDAFDQASTLRWIQSASDGVDGLLFPALVASEVAVTNARGVFDEPIAEWAIGAMCAFATGLHTTIVDQTEARAGPTTDTGNASPGSISWSSGRVRSAAPRLRGLAPSG